MSTTYSADTAEDRAAVRAAGARGALNGIDGKAVIAGICQRFHIDRRELSSCPLGELLHRKGILTEEEALWFDDDASNEEDDQGYEGRVFTSEWEW